MLLRDADGLTLLEHTLPDEGARYPDLSTISPGRQPDAARRVRPRRRQCDADDQRPWAWQAAWPIDRFPAATGLRVLAEVGARPGGLSVRARRPATESTRLRSARYTRGSSSRGISAFQVVGEKVLRLEERLGYVHKGIEKRFETLPILDGCRLAGRVSGDSTVAYAWAYAQALEAIARRRDAAARDMAARARPRSASALPTIWAISAISAMTAASPSVWRNSRGSRRTCCV